MNLQKIMPSEENSISEGSILYDFIYMTFLNRQNYRAIEHISDCQRLNGGLEGGKSMEL